MKIDTKFNVGDRVYALSDKREIKPLNIKSIHITVENEVIIKYHFLGVTNTEFSSGRNGQDIYPSKLEALQAATDLVLKSFKELD